MTETSSKNTGLKIKAVAAYQIVFGLWGIVLTLQLMFARGYNPLILMVNMGIIILYAYSIFCGILLFRKHPAALTYSLINQYLQLVGFSIMGYAFRYVAGIFLMVAADIRDGFALHFNLGLSTWNVQIGSETNYLIVSCNLVAMTLIIFINKLKNRILPEQEMQLLTIGEDVVNN